MRAAVWPPCPGCRSGRPHPSDGGGKSSEPAADSLGGKSSGDGSQPVTDEIEGGKDTGEGKKPGHTKAKGVGKAKLAV